MKIELILDKDCPNVELAREILARALAKAHLPIQWKEWDRADTSAPNYVRKYGSPSFLINEKDILMNEADENCCRLYPRENGALKGVPHVDFLIQYLLVELENEKKE